MQNRYFSQRSLKPHPLDIPPESIGVEFFLKIFPGPILECDFVVSDPDKILSQNFWRDFEPSAGQLKKKGVDLWKSTCFEIFLKSGFGKSSPYWEWNFAPGNFYDVFCLPEERKYSQPNKILSEKNRFFDFKFYRIDEKTGGVKIKIELFEYPLLAWAFLCEKIQINPTCIVEISETKKIHFSAIHSNPQKPDFHYFENFIPLGKAASIFR